MSAYILDPRTIDYLVAWAHRHHHNHSLLRARWPQALAIPPELEHACDGNWLKLIPVSPNDLGSILLRENVRSVRTRYPEDSADTLPGPCDQRRVWRYEFRPIGAKLNPAWVIKSCDCLSYQSCETDDWEETLAHSIMTAIREDAIDALTDDAPWGVTDEDLSPARV